MKRRETKETREKTKLKERRSRMRKRTGRYISEWNQFRSMKLASEFLIENAFKFLSSFRFFLCRLDTSPC